ncbi:hypothetical protein ACFPT6_15695, partial [Streptomyces cinereospinus]
MTATDPRAPALARLAGLIADEARAACLPAPLDGRAWTAGEPARHAGVDHRRAGTARGRGPPASRRGTRAWTTGEPARHAGVDHRRAGTAR